MDKSFIETHKDLIDVMGFWREEYKSVILRSIENGYRTEVIREFGVSDLIIDGDKVLVKWFKRNTPLSDEELKEKYGR